MLGQINDPLEHEADHTAEHVIRMPAPAGTVAAAPQVSSKRAGEVSAKALQMEASDLSAGEAPGIVRDVLRSPGQPLDGTTRAFFEPRFGYDFSQVRVHADAEAAASARAVNASAFTSGKHLVFADGRYAPHASAGQRLLAHELTHTIQQGAVGETGDGLVQRQPASPTPASSTPANASETAPAQPGKAPVNSAIANIPWGRYIDEFTECDYDVNYKVVNYFSNILHLKYSDGAELEFDMESLAPESMTSDAARDALANGRLGAQGRIFPAVLAPRTVPRLWVAREGAMQIQNEAFSSFAKLAVAGVVFVLSVPAMPAGIMNEAAIGSTKATRRTQSGGKGPPGNEPPTSGPPGGPPGPGGGFNKIPYGQTAASLGRVIGARAGEGAKTAKLVGETGPSWINRIIGAVRPLKLAPRESAEVIESATSAAGYKYGPRATLKGGTTVITSAQPGSNQFVIGVHPDGAIVRGTATLRFGADLPGGVSVTDVVWAP